jgi:heptosyltransferase-3
MANNYPRSILIVNIRLIGDVVLSTSLLEVLKSAYPGAGIDFLVNRGTGEFLEKDPRVRRVYYSEKWSSHGRSYSNTYLADIFRKYDIAICMNASDRGILAAIAAGTRTRIGFYEPRNRFGAYWRKLFLSHALLYQEDVHVITRSRDILEALKLEADRLAVRIFWDDADADTVVSALRQNEIEEGYFVVHPFARWRYKYWDVSRFAEISDMVARKYNLRPVWTSSPDKEEVELLHATAQGCSVSPVLIPGTFSLNQMACLIRSASLYIGLDTAISHIAAASGIPVVALYGPTEMWRWHPWNNDASPGSRLPAGTRGTFREGSIVALQAACEHYPCIRPACYRDGIENPCLMALSVEDVFREIFVLMGAARCTGTLPA